MAALLNRLRRKTSSIDISDINFGISKIIWLDPEVNKQTEYQKVQQQFRIIISRLKTFENRKDCEKYILSVPSREQLLLIVNDQLGKELVPYIHNLQQISSIYIYCKDKKANEQWIVRYKKIKAVVTQLDELICQVKTDRGNLPIVERKQTMSSYVVINGTDQLLTKSNISIAYAYLLSNSLFRIKPNELDRTDLFSLCKYYYKNNLLELKIIQEFQQNYSSDKALWWYTRESFLYKMLNKALRVQDINTIFLFHFFIYDLYQQLIENQYQSSVRVYRGQLMNDDEIKDLKQAVGYFISIHTFFSTVIDRDNAFGFLNTRNSFTGLYRVIFEIDADPKVVTTKPFADITKYIDCPEERKMIFSIGSLFRINNVAENDEQVWIIQMTLVGDNDPSLRPIFEQMEKKYGCSDRDATLLSLSRVLREMQKIDEAEKYCHRLLQQHFALNDRLLGMLYDELAEIASIKNNHNLYNQWIQKSNTIKKKSISSTAETVDQLQVDSHLRFSDIVDEKQDILLPIQGYEQMPLVSLEEAVLPLVPILRDIQRKVHTAKLRCANPADGLTSDESAAIMLYTMEWAPSNKSLYSVLNTHLRAIDRQKLKPWFSYLKLLLTGLARLSSISKMVYRGIKLDLSSEYQEKKKFFWWGFSSCTTSLNILKSNQYLGNSGIRTLFHIECTNGKDIRRHSYFQTEEEILLLPATYFEVISCFQMASDLHAIQLKEIKPEFSYLEHVV